MDHLRSLKIFDAVVRLGSFAAAARALDLAPAAATRAVADLERHLGARLLHRTTRALALTDIGENYWQRTCDILRGIAEADAMAGQQQLRPEGTVRVLCPPAFAVHQLAALLPGFSSAYPGIHLDLEVSGPVETADERFDVSILSLGRQTLEGGFVAKPLGKSAFLLCASTAYLAERGTPQVPADVQQHRPLLPAVSGLGREFHIFHPETGQSFKVQLPDMVLATRHLDMLLASAVAGLGMAALPSFMLAKAFQRQDLVHVLPGWRGPQLKLFAAVPSRSQMPARTRVFLDYLTSHIDSTAYDAWWPHEGLSLR